MASGSVCPLVAVAADLEPAAHALVPAQQYPAGSRVDDQR
jgi:hypothetical protein